MKLGIIGLSGSGKKTVFEALTKQPAEAAGKTENRIGTVQVPDARVDVLSKMYSPRKTIYAQVEYLLPGTTGSQKDQNIWTQVRDCDALIQVIRNYKGFGLEDPSPETDFQELNQEMIFADLVVVEKRLERLELDKKRGKTITAEELTLLIKCKELLDQEKPLRESPEISGAHILRGYAFVSAKPLLVLFNNEDDNDALPDTGNALGSSEGVVIRGKLEQELSQMSEEEAEDFLSEFNISASATDRVIEKSYDILGLISFFTVGEDEVRAWTIRKETVALDAAEVIHSDIKKGFIRAEVLAYDHLMETGTYQEAKKKGVVRLEGKTYEVQNGDIINFRFNV